MNPEEVTRVYLTFSPPDEPNGNISAYHAAIYRNGELVFSIDSLPLVSNPNNTMTAVIEGLKGGFNYSIRVFTSIPIVPRRPKFFLRRDKNERTILIGLILNFANICSCTLLFSHHDKSMMICCYFYR